MPGQEDGNVTYVVDGGAGVWAPEPTHILEILRKWLNNPIELKRISDNCTRMAKPNASYLVARTVVEKLRITEGVT